MNTSFGPWSTAITTGANQQLNTFWKTRLAMLPFLNQTVSRGARRTWLFLGAAGALALVLPTAQTVTRPRMASAAGALAAATDSSEKRAADSAAQHGDKPADQFKMDDGSFVEYLPRPSPEERALEQPLDFEVVEMPFEDCVKLFAQRAKINVVLDFQGLADDDVALDQPITMTAKGGRAGSVLNRLLQLVKSDNELGILFEDDQLKITTAPRAGAMLLIRWYPVWDLHPAEAADSQIESSVQFGPGSRFTAPVHIAELIRVLTSSLQPDSWEDLSGPGSVFYVREIQCLAVRQTPEVHREVLQFLRQWREAKRLERAAVAGIAAKAVGDKSKTDKLKDIEDAPHTLKGKK